MIRSRVLAHSYGIQVERDVEALGARVVDEPEHVLRRAGERRPMVEVGQVDGPAAGAPADLDRLAERVEEAVAERVADVGVIEAAEPGRLVRGAPRARPYRRRRPGG